MLVFGSSVLVLSGSGPRRHLSVCRSVTSNRLWSPDPLRQPRRLPDPCTVVAHDGGGSCQLIVGGMHN
jgi:hypothetical protein